MDLRLDKFWTISTTPTREDYMNISVGNSGFIFHSDSIILLHGPWKHQQACSWEKMGKIITRHMDKVLLPLLQPGHMASPVYDLTRLQFISPPITCMHYSSPCACLTGRDGRDTPCQSTPTRERTWTP